MTAAVARALARPEAAKDSALRVAGRETAEVLRGMPDEADADLRAVRTAARAALGDRGYTLAFGRGTARPREEVTAESRSRTHPAR